MAINTVTTSPLRFDISPVPGEGARVCSALVGSAVPKGRGTLFFFSLCFAVALLAFLLPPSTASAFLIGMIGVYGSFFGLQALGRANLRTLQEKDPHALETYSVEIGPHDVYTGCAHVNARYPWHEFLTVTENSEFYLFVRRNGGGAALPKRILDHSQDQLLRNRIREWAPDRGANLAKERQRIAAAI